MGVQIIINGESAIEAMLEVRALAGAMRGLLVGGEPLVQSDGPAAAQPAAPAPAEAAAEAPKKGRGKKAEAPAPAPVVEPESPVVQAQDAADEKAEEAVETEAERAYNHEDIRAVGAQYLTKYGPAAVAQDMKIIYGEAGLTGKIADCKEQAVKDAIYKGIKAALDTNRFNREAVK
jgi:hypothetical protein